MGYHVLYGVPDADPVEGPHLASGGGWLAWCEWVLSLDGYPECHALAENGWSEPRSGLSDLGTELAWLYQEEADEPLSEITKTLLTAVKCKPGKAAALVVTDGTPPAEGEDDDE